MTFRVFALLVASLGLLAQPPSASTAWKGRVVIGGKPVPGATVTVTQGAQSSSQVTDETGRFAFDALKPGGAAVQVQMFGFQPFRKEFPEAERAAEAELAISLRAYRPMMNGARQQAAVETSDQPVQTEVAATVPAAGLSEGGEASESFLVQGSLSRGLAQAPTNGMEFGPGMMMGVPGGQGMMGGEQGAQATAPGFGAQAVGGGATAGGMGGRGGGMGPGGMGPGGGGGPGGPGGFGGPGGRPGGPGGPGGGDPRQAIANMSPEERERMRKMFQERMQQRGFAEGFGNRSNRTRDQIRGGFLYSVRNSALDATPFSVNGRSVSKPEYSQQRFGFNLGGPLHLGNIFPADKTFFFLNYTGMHGENPYSSFAVMPSDAMRTGDFSSLLAQKNLVLYDPQSGSPFPNNVIPSSRISPTSQGLLQLIPTPNSTGATQNYQLISAIPQDTHTLSARLNRTLTTKDRLAVSFNWQTRSSEALQLYGWTDASSGNGQSYDVTWSHNFNPRLITNTRLRYNFNRNQLSPYFAYGTDISGALGITGNSRDPVNYGPPNLDFTNFGGLSDGNHSQRRSHTWNFSNSWTIVRGRHTVTTGFDLTRLQNNNLAEQNARGTMFFGGLATSGLGASGERLANSGYDFADFLLGFPQQSSIRYGGADTYMRQSQYAGFVQDDFRVSKRLTINIGLRYEDWEPYVEKYDRLANISFRGDQAIIVTPGATDLYGNTASRTLLQPDRNNFSPRIAFAWRPNEKGKTLVRGGYSLFYDSSIYTRVPSRLASQPPFAVGAQYNSGIDALLTITNPFTGAQDDVIQNTYAINTAYRLPYAQTWNISVQRDLAHGWILEGGILGTKGTALVVQRAPNRYPPGEGNFGTRPIPGALSFTYDSPEGNSIYHAGQLRLTRRMRRGFTLSALYTYSKSIDNASSIGGSGNIVVQDDRNIAAERGLSSFDRRHQLQLNGFIASPFGPRGTFLKQNNVWSRMLRDWNLNAGITANSGTPLTATVLGATADTSGTGTVGSQRADSTGLDVSSGSGYFNTAAYTAPPAIRYGNAGRNTIPGPGFFSMNASFGRQFQLGETARRGLEVRATAENLLNSVNITGLGTVVNSANYGLATRAGDMRTIQLQLRLRF